MTGDDESCTGVIPTVMASSDVESLRNKRKMWWEWMYGDDRHSIVRQISNMTWRAAVYRVINRARRHLPRTPEGEAKGNGMIHRFIDDAYVTTQIMSIRRLLDANTSCGKRSVSSLSRLLHSMLESRHLLTRANIIAVEGLPYDYERFNRDRLEEHSRGEPIHEEVEIAEIPADGHVSGMRHRVIDKLSGTKANHRSKADAVSQQLLTSLTGKLDAARQDIRTYADKFVAHAATPESRGAVGADELDLTYGHLDAAHRGICEVSVVAALILAGPKRSFLPIPQFGHLKHIEEPFVAPDSVGELEKAWEEYEQLTLSWRDWDWQCVVCIGGPDAAEKGDA